MVSSQSLPRLILAAFALGVGMPPVAAASQAEPPRARLTEDLRLDATAEDFPRVNNVFVGPKGQIVVSIPLDQQLRFYTADGKRIGAFGRRGSGPGEFQALGNGGWAGDTLWVYDRSQRRGTAIKPDATLLRTDLLPELTLPPESPGGPPRTVEFFTPLAIYRDGSMVGEGRYGVTLPSGVNSTSERYMIRVAPDGAARVLYKPPAYEDPRWYMEASGFGNPVPFAQRPLRGVAFDGSRFADLTAHVTSPEGGTFAITVVTATGDTAFARTYPFRGVAVSRRAADSALAAFIRPPGAAREGPSNLGEQFQAIARRKMPPVHAPVDALLPGLDGTLWVGLRRTEEGRVMLVLDGHGVPVATVLTPPRSVIVQASAANVWVIETDADGLPSVVRYRVSGLTCANAGCR